MMEYHPVRKCLVVVLTASLALASNPLLARERRGAQLLLSLKDGRQAAGELVAVRGRSLLLLDAQGKDESFEISGVAAVRVVRKSLVSKGLWIGPLAGAGVGGIIGGVSAAVEGAGSLSLIYAGLGATIGAVIGLGVGAGLGAAVGKDTVYELAGKSAIEVQEVLSELRKKARVREA